MRTTKQTVIELEKDDTIRIVAGSISFTISYEPGERGLVLDELPQINHINTFRTSALHEDDLDECVVATDDENGKLVPANYHRASIFLN